MPRVVGLVPLECANLSEESLHCGFVEELAVEITRVPVDQHAADVEDDRGHRFVRCHVPDITRRHYENTSQALVGPILD
jgi:hypothetical protein